MISRVDDKILIPLISILGGLITGVLGSLIAPWVHWGIEKKKQKLNYRKELIAKWRQMVRELLKYYDDNRNSLPVLRKVITRYEAFYSLKGHLSQDIIFRIEADTYEDALALITDEINGIEKEWRLL